MTQRIGQQFKEHDHSTDLEGGPQLNPDEIHSVAQVTNDDDVQAVLDDAAAEIGDTSERRRVDVKASETVGLDTIDVPPGIVLDIRGCTLYPDGAYMLQVDGGAHVIGHGAVIRAYGYAGAVFLFDHSSNPVGSNVPATITGYPQVWGSNDGQWCVKTDNSAGAGVSGINAEVGCRNSGGLVQVLNGGGYTNNCRFAFTGSTAPESTQTVIDFAAAEAKQVAGNVVEAPSVCQVKKGAQFVNFNRAFYNTVRGQFADPANANEADRAPVEFGNSTGGNAVRLDRQYTFGSSRVMRSLDSVNEVGPQDRPWMLPMDLSGRVPEDLGVVATDDGTNTTGQGVPCRWVDTDGDGSGDAWQPFDGSATFV